jgi:hypothetical protein
VAKQVEPQWGQKWNVDKASFKKSYSANFYKFSFRNQKSYQQFVLSQKRSNFATRNFGIKKKNT